MLQNFGLQINYFDDSSIYINIESSEVLLYEPEKISKTKQNFKIAYSQRYLAPEMITSDAESSVYTTRHIVAVILFMLMFGSHPLEGKCTIPCLTYKDEQNLYGYNPVFIADPNNDCNKADEYINHEFIVLWEYVPEYVKQIFMDAFNYERLSNPRKRLHLSSYRNVFEKYLNQLESCNCDALSFIDNNFVEKCVFCGKAINKNI